MKHYYRWDDFPEKQVSYLQDRDNASLLKVKIMSSEKIMLTQIDAKKGASVPKHYHEAEQIIIVEIGHMVVTSGGDEMHNLYAGDIWVCPSNCSHSVDYVEDTKALEIVSPIRLDNFTGYTISHTYFV